MSWEIWNMNFRNGLMINFNVTEIQNRETNAKQLRECWNKWNDYSKTLPSVQQDDFLKIWLLFHHFCENFLSLAYLQQRQWRDKPQRWVRKIHSCLFAVLSTPWFQWDSIISEEDMANRNLTTNKTLNWHSLRLLLIWAHTLALCFVERISTFVIPFLKGCL